MRNDKARDDGKDGWLDRDSVGGKDGGGRLHEGREAASGHMKVSVRWVDTKKGTDDNPEVQCVALIGAVALNSADFATVASNSALSSINPTIHGTFFLIFVA